MSGISIFVLLGRSLALGGNTVSKGEKSSLKLCIYSQDNAYYRVFCFVLR